MSIHAFPRRLASALCVAMTLLAACSRPVAQGIALGRASLPDGFYSVLVETETADAARQAFPRAVVLPYDRLYTGSEEPEERSWLAIDPVGAVPLQLAEAPEARDDDDGRALLSVRLAEDRVDDLAAFTAAHLDRLAAILVDGEVVTMHRIRAVIEDGRLQITRCDPSSCAAIRMRLVD